jgi:hypothetical protein
MIPDLTNDPKAAYYGREFERALALIDEGNMRAALARLAREASRNGIPIPLNAAMMIGRLLTTPTTKAQGGQFLPATMRFGRVEALRLHTNLSLTAACKLVACLEDPMINPKTILNAFDGREAVYRQCALHTGGHHSFKPKGDPKVDVLLFSDEDRRNIPAYMRTMTPRADVDSVKAFLSN